MNKNLRRRFLVLSALLALLLQVQSVFACEMFEEHAGPVAECCCGGMECDCCVLEVSVSTPAQDAHPVLPAAQLALELPLLAAPPPNQWPPIPPPALVGHSEIPLEPSHPGGRTWLATLRLRI